MTPLVGAGSEPDNPSLERAGGVHDTDIPLTSWRQVASVMDEPRASRPREEVVGRRGRQIPGHRSSPVNRAADYSPTVNPSRNRSNSGRYSARRFWPVGGRCLSHPLRLGRTGRHGVTAKQAARRARRALLVSFPVPVAVSLAHAHLAHSVAHCPVGPCRGQPYQWRIPSLPSVMVRDQRGRREGARIAFVIDRFPIQVRAPAPQGLMNGAG
jgi:hypothetical protein